MLERSRARVVVQTSIAAARARIDWDDPNGARRYRPYRAYAASKLALSLFGMALARRSGGITVNLCHPGVVPGTAIAAPVRALLPQDLVNWAVRRVGNAPATAAQTAFDAATSAAGPPMMFAPSAPFGLWGASAPRAPFRRFLDADEAARVWREVDGLLS